MLLSVPNVSDFLNENSKREELVKQAVCIVTPDAYGAITNGGIGTATYHQACYFSARGMDVTLLYTNDACESHDRRYWKDHYRDHSVRLLFLDEVVKHQNTMFGRWFLERSLMVKNYLVGKNFDHIYFQDWKASGFHTIQAKRVGLGFQDTKLVVVVNSPHEWVHEESVNWADRGDLYYPYLKWCERYCCEHADLLQAPSQYIYDWLEERGWKLSANRFVTPCIRLIAHSDADTHDAVAATTPTDKLRLAFFSRLETRKGLEVFVDALDMLADKSRVEKVFFLGREAAVSPTTYNTELERAKRYIERRMHEVGIPFQIVDTLNSDDAIALLKREKLLAIMPSLAETFGLVVYECILNQIPFLCSDIPPFREMVHPDGIFGKTAKALSAKLADADMQTLAAIRHHIDPGVVNESWISCLETMDETAVKSPSRSVTRNLPLVSVCVPYYNYGKYLPGLIRSLESSSYKNIEVIVVNDGSTDPFSNEVFDNWRRSLDSKPNWRFISKENGGIGQTRNFAARMAKGDYLVFMDADNEAKPHMIESFVRCMQTSGMDCLTCFLDCFDHTITAPNDQTPLNWVYAPIGNCPEISLFENTFGDANFIIKRHVFVEIGGFKEDRTTSFEDYDFLTRLSLRGGAIDVIPEGLVWYRVTTEGFSRNTSLVRNHSRVLKGYCEDPSRLDFRFLSQHILMPMYYNYLIYRHSELATEQRILPDSLHPAIESLAMKVQLFVNRMAPRGSRRRMIFRRVAQRLGRLKGDS